MKSMDQYRSLLSHAREKAPKPSGLIMHDYATLRALVRAWLGARNPRERNVRAEQVSTFAWALDRLGPT